MKCKFPSIKVNAENKPDENDSFRYQYRINNKLILGPLITAWRFPFNSRAFSRCCIVTCIYVSYHGQLLLLVVCY